MPSKWEIYEGPSRSLNIAAASILRAGTLHLNPKAMELLGKDAKYVQLLYDREENRIGLRPLQRATRRARKVTKSMHTASVNLRGFLNRYEIQHEKTRRFRAARGEKGMVVIDLNKLV